MADTVYERAKNPEKIKKDTEFRRVVKQLSYNKLATFGIILFVVLLVICLMAPIIAPYDYQAIDLRNKSQTPNAEHLFGTDNLGRDILSRVLYGGRYSITMGIFSLMVSLVLGTILGSIAGYFGDWVDNIIMRALDIIQSLPGMLLTIVLSAVLGSGYINTILALSINGIPGEARMLRGQILKVRGNEYVEAAQAINCSKTRIITQHILPNSFSPMIVQASMGIASRIMTASSLSFIGLGVQPPAPEWGAMLSDARVYIREYPHMILFPGIAIALTVLSLNLFGDGLRDALDPKLKR